VEPIAITPVTGGSLDPADVIGRDTQIIEALRLLREGNDLVINDPRRMGKTALLDRLCNEPGLDTLAVKIDYEGVASADEFVLRTVKAIRSNQPTWKRVEGAIAAFVDDVDAKKGPISIKASFKRKPAQELLIDLIERIDDKLVGDELLVVAMDEVTIGIQNIARSESPAAANQLLQALRRVRQASTSIRWIVTGSVGFHHVIRQSESTEGVINDLTELPVGPLSSSDAAFLTTCLVTGIDRQIEPDQVKIVVDRSGAIPFIIHHVVHRLRSFEQQVTTDEVERAFEQFFGDRDASRALTHLLTRIDAYWGDDQKVVRSILDTVAIAGPVTSVDLCERVEDERLEDRDEYLRIMNGLVDDHYIVKDDGCWRWRYDVLRLVWIRRRELDS